MEVENQETNPGYDRIVEQILGLRANTEEHPDTGAESPTQSGGSSNELTPECADTNEEEDETGQSEAQKRPKMTSNKPHRDCRKVSKRKMDHPKQVKQELTDDDGVEADHGELPQEWVPRLPEPLEMPPEKKKAVTEQTKLPTGKRKGKNKAKSKGPPKRKEFIRVFRKMKAAVEMKKAFSSMCKVCYSIHVDSEADECPLTKPEQIIHNYVGSPLGHEIPKEITFGMSRVHENRLSLFARDAIPVLTQFGPLKGKRLYRKDFAKCRLFNVDLEHFWPVKTLEKNETNLVDVHVVDYVDTQDVDSSNWLRYLIPENVSSLLNPLEMSLKCNVQRILKDDEIYFVTIREINPGDELYLRAMEPPERVFFNLGAILSVTGPSDVKAVLRCVVCREDRHAKNVEFANVASMVRHRQLCHPHFRGTCDYARIFQCHVCGEEFQNIRRIGVHRKEENKNPMLKEHLNYCNFCDYHTVASTSLSAHVMDKHKYAEDHEFPCNQCDMTFESFHQFRYHETTKHKRHTAEERTCPRCNKVFNSFRTMSVHIQTVHDKLNFEVCETCGRKFRDVYQLRVHSLTHSGIKPFQCDISGCTAAFTTKQWLQKHYRSAHNFTDDTMPAIQRKVAFPDQMGLKQIAPRRCINSTMRYNKKVKKMAETESDLIVSEEDLPFRVSVGSEEVKQTPGSSRTASGKEKSTTAHALPTSSSPHKAPVVAAKSSGHTSVTSKECDVTEELDRNYFRHFDPNELRMAERNIPLSTERNLSYMNDPNIGAFSAFLAEHAHSNLFYTNMSS